MSNWFRSLSCGGIAPPSRTVYVDLGYRRVDRDNPGIEVIHRGKIKSLSKHQLRGLKRRQAVEPVFGQLNCWLQSETGEFCTQCCAPPTTTCAGCCVSTPPGRSIRFLAPDWPIATGIVKRTWASPFLNDDRISVSVCPLVEFFRVDYLTKPSRFSVVKTRLGLVESEGTIAPSPDR